MLSWLVLLLMISSLLNVAYLIPIVVRAFYNDPDPKTHDDHDDHGHDATAAHHPGDAGASNQWKIGKFEEAPLVCVGAICLTAFGCIALFFYADIIYRFLLPIISGGAS